MSIHAISEVSTDIQYGVGQTAKIVLFVREQHLPSVASSLNEDATANAVLNPTCNVEDSSRRQGPWPKARKTMAPSITQ